MWPLRRSGARWTWRCSGRYGHEPARATSRVAAALHVLGTRSIRARPLAIDDLQWLDRPTVNVLRLSAPNRAGPRRRARCEPLSLSEDDRLALAEALPPRVDRLTVAPLDMSALDTSCSRAFARPSSAPRFAGPRDIGWQPAFSPSSSHGRCSTRTPMPFRANRSRRHRACRSSGRPPGRISPPTRRVLLAASAPRTSNRRSRARGNRERRRHAPRSIRPSTLRWSRARRRGAIHPPAAVVGRVRGGVSRGGAAAPSAGRSRCRPGRAGPASWASAPTRPTATSQPRSSTQFGESGA